MFTSRFQNWVRAGARRLASVLGLEWLRPNWLTLIGLAITAGAAVLVGVGNLLAGGIVLVAGAVFDILDGAVARLAGSAQRYGAFLDSTTDRYSEGFIYVALLYHFLSSGRHDTVAPMLVIASLAGSQLVSYVRARAQSLGFECDGGLLARPERVVLMVAGLVIPVLLVPALWVLAVVTNLTALQRIWLVWRQAQSTAPD